MSADPCPNCEGRGWVEGIRPICCGNTINGGCRGGCAVPEQYQEECAHCSGSGTDPTSRSDADRKEKQ